MIYLNKREQEIKAREEAATGGPPDQYWHLDNRWPDHVISYGGNSIAILKHPFNDISLRGNVHNDLLFIARAREDIPYLLETIKALRKEKEEINE